MHNLLIDSDVGFRVVPLLETSRIAPLVTYVGRDNQTTVRQRSPQTQRQIRRLDSFHLHSEI